MQGITGSDDDISFEWFFNQEDHFNNQQASTYALLMSINYTPNIQTIFYKLQLNIDK